MQEIKLLVLDVDGVLTDGSITIDAHGAETKTFFARDGYALRMWHEAGHLSGIITGRVAPAVDRRAADLGITCVVQGATDKRPVFEDLCRKLGLSPGAACYVGDDLPDLPPVRLAGLGVAVADACAELKAEADLVTRRAGGRGAVREVVERILKAQNRWQDLVRQY